MYTLSDFILPSMDSQQYQESVVSFYSTCSRRVLNDEELNVPSSCLYQSLLHWCVSNNICLWYTVAIVENVVHAEVSWMSKTSPVHMAIWQMHLNIVQCIIFFSRTGPCQSGAKMQYLSSGGSKIAFLVKCKLNCCWKGSLTPAGRWKWINFLCQNLGGTRGRRHLLRITRLSLKSATKSTGCTGNEKNYYSCLLMCNKSSILLKADFRSQPCQGHRECEVPVRCSVHQEIWRKSNSPGTYCIISWFGFSLFVISWAVGLFGKWWDSSFYVLYLFIYSWSKLALFAHFHS